MGLCHPAALAAFALASALASTVGAAPPPAPVVVTVTGSSTLAGHRDKHRYDAWHVLVEVALSSPRQVAGDRFWCEGKPDEGIGEGLTFELSAPAVIDEIVIAGGVWTSDALFHANNIPTAVDVVADDGRKQRVALPAVAQSVTVPLGGAPIKRLVITFASVKKGRMNDTCISGVRLHSATPLLVGISPADADALMPALAEVHRALTHCDAALIKKHIVFPLPVYDTVHFQRSIKGAAAFAKACRDPLRFSSWSAALDDPDLGQDELVTRAPGKVTVLDDTVSLDLVRQGGEWKLVNLHDDTP